MPLQTAWNFSDEKFKLIDSRKLLSFWESEIISMCEIKGESELRLRKIQSISDQTKKLWSVFNLRRDELDRDYMSDEKMLLGYLSAFFIPNIERVRHALISSGIQKSMSNLSTSKVIRVLDFGAGPLSATFGTLVAIEELLSNTDLKINKPSKIEITVVERSEKAFQFGKRCLEASQSSDVEISLERLTSVPKQREFDFVLAANVLNEIPQKHQANTLNVLVDAMSSEKPSLMLLLEPGQESHAKRLSELRDQLLSGPALHSKHILAPCPHNKPCPLGPKMNRTDWCWFRSKFTPPPFQSELDSKSRLDHTELAYSFFLLEGLTYSAEKKPWAVCVSDEMPTGPDSDSEKRSLYYRKNALNLSQVSEEICSEIAKFGQKTKLCSKEGTLLGGLRKKTQQQKFQRGDVAGESDFTLVIKEK